jgi:tRNA threonylcarbamoyladenosine biosynthesis protein TsaB
MIALAIDTAAELAGVALLEDEMLLAEVTWRSRQNHSRELLPTLDWLLQRCQRSKDDLGAIFVCLGPGSYAGLRVGLSTAKALAYSLDLQIAGVGRLAADAYPIAAASSARVVALQVAGRAELAWAVYAWRDGELLELQAPQLGPRERLVETLSAGDIVCGEIEKLDDETRGLLASRGTRTVTSGASRVLAVARLGALRLSRGDVDNGDSLVPLYLRAPAIGPQPPR